MLQGIGIVKTEYGKVSGVTKNGITLFKSIPYAAPPVGELRWKTPQNPACWQDERVCDKFGDIAWQPTGFVGAKALKENKQSEDCLSLNIWTPAQTPYDDLPVLFWIHGGAFQGGTGQEELYHGWHLVAKGVIIVTINYRLGAMGFLAHPELSQESQNAVSGNYGLLDIIQALKWVKKNISAFGGNPRCVTIDGQSAGAMAVNCLLASPLANGLFSGAVIQSGGPLPGNGTTLRQGEKIGLTLLESIGCNRIDQMRKVPASDIINAALPESTGVMPFQPYVDGYVLPMAPYEAFLTGHISNVPIMFGSNADEGLFFHEDSYEEFIKAVKKFTGENFNEFSTLYSVNEENYEVTQLEFARDYTFSSLRYVAQKLELIHPSPVYHYYFCQPTVMEDGKVIGAIHSSELFYVFHTLSCMGGSTIDGSEWHPRITYSEYSLSDYMTSYWTSFVKNGDPNTVGLPTWPNYTKSKDLYMHFIADNTIAKKTQYPERIDFITRQLEVYCKKQFHIYR